VVLVLGLIALLAVQASDTGFPALRDGELPLWSLTVDGHLPEAFSVVGYAFYMQPMMMPLLQEMPPGHGGITVMTRAVHTTLFGAHPVVALLGTLAGPACLVARGAQCALVCAEHALLMAAPVLHAGTRAMVACTGVALLVYFATGFFGASVYGQGTQGNIMVNQLVQGAPATAVLYGAMLVYLALGMTTTQYALRASLDLMLAGEGAPFTWRRHVSARACVARVCCAAGRSCTWRSVADCGCAAQHKHRCC
jgi:hypothetical protein